MPDRLLWFIGAEHGGLKARPFPWTFLRLGSKGWLVADRGLARAKSSILGEKGYGDPSCKAAATAQAVLIGYKLGTWYQLTSPCITWR